MQELTIAGGCFWGMEELFRVRPGVVHTVVGYTGGTNSEPTYAYHPGHAETLRIEFDPGQTSRAELLDYFFSIHDPTSPNRQGNDVGESYRSSIFATDEGEVSEARAAIIRNQTNWSRPIVTTIEPKATFWPAEEKHQAYLQKNPGGYPCHYERDFS
jgi:peptide-methionine (S)-S-oxide reductase